jgi:hypothetical protein
VLWRLGRKRRVLVGFVSPLNRLLLELRSFDPPAKARQDPGGDTFDKNVMAAWARE